MAKKQTTSFGVRVARLVSLQISIMAIWLMVFAVAIKGV